MSDYVFRTTKYISLQPNMEEDPTPSLGAQRISNEPAISQRIAQFLPSAHERSSLVSRAFLARPANNDRLCLPTGSTFRTNPEAGRCTPWTSLDARSQCCVQSDAAFLKKVAAIMRGALAEFHRDRIAHEIHRWMETVTAPFSHIPANISVDFSDAHGNKELLKLAVKAQTNIPIEVRLTGANQTIDAGEFDLGRLRGPLRLTSGANGSVAYASLGEMLQDGPYLESLVVDCPIVFTNPSPVVVAQLIDDSRNTKQDDVFRYEFTLPLTISVTDVVDELLSSNLFSSMWEGTVDPGAQRWVSADQYTRVREYEDQNRLVVIVRDAT